MSNMIDDPKNLKKKKVGGAEAWTLEEIRKGILYFFKIHSRYPTAHDFDQFEFLPSARTIQRAFGGLEKIRNELNIGDVKNFTKGEYRSNIAKKTHSKAMLYEEEFYNFLISRLDEIKVHEHKIIRPGNICCDFFIYRKHTSEGGIVIDIFYAQDILSLGSVIRIKGKRYLNLPFKVFFVLVGNKDIKQNDIDNLILNKQNALSENIFVLQEEIFKENLLNYLT
jgi:hypothetical protein